MTQALQVPSAPARCRHLRRKNGVLLRIVEKTDRTRYAHALRHGCRHRMCEGVHGTEEDAMGSESAEMDSPHATARPQEQGEDRAWDACGVWVKVPPEAQEPPVSSGGPEDPEAPAQHAPPGARVDAVRHHVYRALPVQSSAEDSRGFVDLSVEDEVLARGCSHAPGGESSSDQAADAPAGDAAYSEVPSFDDLVTRTAQSQDDRVDLSAAMSSVVTEEPPEPRGCSMPCPSGSCDTTEFDDLLSSLSHDAPEYPVDSDPITYSASEPSSEGLVRGAPFSDVDAVAQSLMGDAQVAAQGAQASTSGDASTDLLLKIAQEISSIRADLDQLKGTFSRQAGAEPAQAPATAPAPEGTEAAYSGFFCDDDPDETIALTNDELNNILITSEFTEEDGKDSAADAFGGELSGFESSHIESAAGDFSYLEKDDHAAARVAQEQWVQQGRATLGNEVFDVKEQGAHADRDAAAGPSPVAKDDASPEAQRAHVSSTGLDAAGTEQPLNTENVFDDDDTQREDTSFPLPEEQELDVSVPSLEFSAPHAIETAASESSEVATPVAIESPPQSEAARPAQGDSANLAPPLSKSLADEVRSVLGYMDRLLESLPEEKIEEFARSEYFHTYKHLFDELGIS